MSTHSIAEASNSLSKLVARAMAGETVILTRHGHEVARIVGMDTEAAKTMTESDADVVRRFTDSLGEPPPMNAARLVREMRDEGY